MYKFIIDTDQYSGNFEREMTAYLTGCVGECGVGDEYVDLFKKENVNNITFDNVMFIQDRGCARPCSIEITPGWFNDGIGNVYRENCFDEKQVLKKYSDSVRSYESVYIKQKENYRERLQKGEKVSNWTVEACNREISNHNKKIQDAENLKSIKKYKAYNSVVIFFEIKPTDEQINFMKQQANKFTQVLSSVSSWKNTGKIEVENFRLFKQTTETATIENI